MAFDQYLTATVTVTPDNDAYTANDCVGGLATITLTGLVVNGGILNKIRIVDDDNEGAALVLWLFNAEPSEIADDAALNLEAADLQKLMVRQVVAVGDWVTNNSLKWASYGDLNDVITVDDTGSFYMYVQCTGTPTYAATKTLKFYFDILTQGS